MPRRAGALALNILLRVAATQQRTRIARNGGNSACPATNNRVLPGIFYIAAALFTPRRLPPPRATRRALLAPFRLALLDESADALGGVVPEHVLGDRGARDPVGGVDFRLDLLIEELLAGRAHGRRLVDDAVHQAPE